VLGRTLVSGPTDAKYAEVAFPSTTISTTAATSLPTPTTAAATTNAAAFAVFVTTTALANGKGKKITKAPGRVHVVGQLQQKGDQEGESVRRRGIRRSR
jgi:hypothetical protein